ncbi:restriction endonuclease [Sphingomonas sp. PP-F2F-A104-K0414]|uniref:restriction endonuclease n=1 Tax=Sphingomonas sp. PP-F2F-A104-K0414 TaxID=2135661 RepID=UPI0010F408DB|nr:restriction endonuclease [Sphingomonas sp. PP-F2F-A104-K0414]TCQ01042.1 restriction endonuclease [Sphingomonas sp. PP-F2F-A104-K0414]
MDQISPSKIRFIKLGAGGRWEGALDRGRLEWGTKDDRHVAGLTGDWAAVSQAYIAQGRIQSTATGYTNEARAFFDGDSDAMWITFARGRMWWCLANPEVHVAADGNGIDAAYYRATRGGWSDRDIDGRVLDFERLSTRLSQLQGYQRTICSLREDQEALCRRYINATTDPVQAAVAAARLELRLHLQALIQQLTWHDFEQLIDLALARTGWVRMSSLGGTMKDVDLVVEQSFTRERMAVQIKSSANQQVVDDYARRLDERNAGERIMLICHSPAGTLVVPPSTGSRRLELVQGSEVADLAINAGLVDWTIARAL